MSKLNIVKIGGNVIENSQLLESFLKDFANLKGYKILVHGGGKEASKLAQKLGKNEWYAAYRVRIAKVERDYEFF